MKRQLIGLTIISLLCTWASAHSLQPRPNFDPQPPTPVVPGVKLANQPRVQLAILLDTSNSMDGLISQAKIQLWSIVNEFIYARRDGQAPEIQVALYEYGNNRLPASGGHIRRVLPFTSDLDRVSEALFALTTDGGNEYCGWVIQEALTHLDWDLNRRTLKTLFIAGNEPFTQGNVDYRMGCGAARQQGILINTIHCGSEADGQHGEWQRGAALAKGHFLNINQNQAVVHIPAPQDEAIAQLNERLNHTYVAYGHEGARHQEMQIEQDSNAAKLSPEAHVQRVVTKSAKIYDNRAWDLVDANRQKDFKLENIYESELPTEMQGMSPQQRQDYIKAKSTERAQIQKQIQTLNEQRRTYVAQVQAQHSLSDNTLGSAILQAIRTQATAQGFIFENSKN